MSDDNVVNMSGYTHCCKCGNLVPICSESVWGNYYVCKNCGWGHNVEANTGMQFYPEDPEDEPS